MKESGYNNPYLNFDDEPNWLVTYADLMTLLLVFFVLLYSLSFFEKEQYKETISDIKTAARQNPEFSGLMDFIGEPEFLNQKIRIDDITGLRTRDSALFSTVNHMIQKAPGAEHLSLDARNGQLVITVSGEALFASGAARLYPAAKLNIDRMIGVFQDYPEYNINIKGHTDNEPINTEAFPSNWELSAIRATTVLKHLISRGVDPNRLTATGYGDMIPLVPNTTDENRTKNRRVEFVLEKKDRG